MVSYQMDLNDERRAAAIDVALASPGNVRRRRIGGPILVVLGVLLVAIGVLFLGSGSDVLDVAYLVLGAVAIVLGARARAFQRFVLRRAETLVDDAFRFGEVRYTFDEDGVTVDSQVGHGVSYWPSFREWGTMGDYLYLRRGDNKLVLVDCRELAPDELEEVRALVERHVGSRRDA
ncbi:MAG TPA: YcxB family protein [Candidatus Olsenella pullicola]|nr:YcxB family protein [Candidatus Olsenella pullicola]